MTLAVMTGGTAGLGKAAAETLLCAPDLRLLIGARTAGATVGAERLPLDLDSLDSARAFAADVIVRLGGAKIDVLILNAGVNLPGDERRTLDGFERHFGVNHLAHYLILRALDPYLAPGARVVVTTSDTHDPAVNRLAPPTTADAAALAHPAHDARLNAFKRGFRCYAASKLCNILTVRGFAALPGTAARGITAIAFNPGFTPDTNIGRDASALVKLALVVVVPVMKLFTSVNTAREAGEALAGLASGGIAPPPGRFYASLVKGKLTWPEPSALARDDAARDALWRDSAALAGIAATTESKELS